LPNTLHNRLYEIAKSDLRTAKILTKNSSYPQAIYFYAQAFEKASKSVIALYIIKNKKLPEQSEQKSDTKDSEPKEWNESEISKELGKTYGHRLMSLTLSIAILLTERDKDLYLSRGGKETDPLIQILNEALEKIKSRKKEDKMGLIAYYENNVKGIHERLFTRLKENTPIQSGEPTDWEYLRKRYKNPKTRYGKFAQLTQSLFPLLDGMDIYTRYPMEDVDYNNFMFLSRYEIKEACSLMGEMIEELIDLVPLVWDRIESMGPIIK
jgi:HEPN domain